MKRKVTRSRLFLLTEENVSAIYRRMQQARTMPGPVDKQQLCLCNNDRCEYDRAIQRPVFNRSGNLHNMTETRDVRIGFCQVEDISKVHDAAVLAFPHFAPLRDLGMHNNFYIHSPPQPGIIYRRQRKYGEAHGTGRLPRRSVEMDPPAKRQNPVST